MCVIATLRFNQPMRKPKLTTQLVEKAVEMKFHGLSNADICKGLGIAEQTFYRWLREDDTKLKRSSGRARGRALLSRPDRMV